MKVAIVKYSSGNVGSVLNALRRLGIEGLLTDDPAELRTADKIIFPGVGEASSAMRLLRQHGLDDVIRTLTQPVLAICLGMQLLCSRSDEGDTECLGILPGRARRFAAGDIKVPHMGWNVLSSLRSPLFDGVGEGERVYFVHSYFVDVGEDTIAECDYGGSFSAAVARGNFYGVQFHPEKSSRVGAGILENFLKLR